MGNPDCMRRTTEGEGNALPKEISIGKADDAAAPSRDSGFVARRGEASEADEAASPSRDSGLVERGGDEGSEPCDNSTGARHRWQGLLPDHPHRTPHCEQAGLNPRGEASSSQREQMRWRPAAPSKCPTKWWGGQARRSRHAHSAASGGVSRVCGDLGVDGERQEEGEGGAQGIAPTTWLSHSSRPRGATAPSSGL